VSPLESEKYHEYRDGAAFKRLGIQSRLGTPLSEFWPARGPVWDGLAVIGSGTPLLLEAKAHIPESASPGTKATPKSRTLIEKSLVEARRYISPRSKAIWSSTFYQYANRLAFQYYLRRVNDIRSRLVFLYFTNAVDVDGPRTVQEWKGAIRLIHSVLGIPAELKDFGVYEAFVDAKLLADSV